MPQQDSRFPECHGRANSQRLGPTLDVAPSQGRRDTWRGCCENDNQENDNGGLSAPVASRSYCRSANCYLVHIAYAFQAVSATVSSTVHTLVALG